MIQEEYKPLPLAVPCFEAVRISKFTVLRVVTSCGGEEPRVVTHYINVEERLISTNKGHKVIILTTLSFYMGFYLGPKSHSSLPLSH